MTPPRKLNPADEKALRNDLKAKDLISGRFLYRHEDLARKYNVHVDTIRRYAFKWKLFRQGQQAQEGEG